jgi:hypothetical protein
MTPVTIGSVSLSGWSGGLTCASSCAAAAASPGRCTASRCSQEGRRCRGLGGQKLWPACVRTACKPAAAVVATTASVSSGHFRCGVHWRHPHEQMPRKCLHRCPRRPRHCHGKGPPKSCSQGGHRRWSILSCFRLTKFFNLGSIRSCVIIHNVQRTYMEHTT